VFQVKIKAEERQRLPLMEGIMNKRRKMKDECPNYSVH